MNLLIENPTALSIVEKNATDRQPFPLNVKNLVKSTDLQKKYSSVVKVG